MFRLLLPVLLSAAQFLFASRLSSQQSSLNPSSCPCTLRGTVVDSVTGNPIHNAFVQASPGSAWSALTDSEGKFQFDALPAGPLTLNAAKPGFLSNDEFGSSAPQSSSIQLGTDAAPAILKLTPEGVIFGQVTDENGEPLEGFSVSLIYRNPRGRAFSEEFRQRVLTDDEGKFRIAGLHPGFCYLSLRPTADPALTSTKNTAIPRGFAPVFYPAAPDFDSATLIKVLPGISEQVNVSLKREPFVQLTGTVSGYSPEQQVVLNLQDSLGEPIPQKITFDASIGSFHTKWIPPGSYTVSARTYVQLSVDASRSLSFASQLVSAHSNLSGIHLVLQPAVNIPIVIHGLPPDPEQEQSSHFRILLVAKGQSSGGRAYFPTWTNPRSAAPSASLSFMVEGVEPGTYELHAEFFPAATYYLESATWGSTDLLRDPLVLDSSGAVPPIDISVREGAARLTGIVVSTGDQPCSALVVAFPPDQQTRPKFVSCSADGDFSLPGLAPGAYRVIALDNMSSLDLENPHVLQRISTRAQEVTLAPGQKASLRLELTTVGE